MQQNKVQRKSLRIANLSAKVSSNTITEVKQNIAFMIDYISNDFKDNIIGKATMLNKLYRYVHENINVVKSNSKPETFNRFLNIMNSKASLLLDKPHVYANENPYNYRLKMLRDEFISVKDYNDKLYYYYKNN